MELKKEYNESQIRHLEMTQNIITRMNTNSFQAKGFSIALTTALVAFYGVSKDDWVLIVGMFMSFFLWLLDGYYLKQERVFRAIYKDLLQKENPINLFQFPFEDYKDFKYSIIYAMLVSINCLLYLILLGIYILLSIKN